MLFKCKTSGKVIYVTGRNRLRRLASQSGTKKYIPIMVRRKGIMANGVKLATSLSELRVGSVFPDNDDTLRSSNEQQTIS